MSELSDLYQEVILDHSRHPHNFHAMEDATRKAEGYNPLCGDQVTVYLKLDGETIQDISFVGNGCAISRASASLLTQSLKGKTSAEAEKLFESFHRVVTGHGVNGDRASLGKLEVFAGVSEFPARVKCATLAWHTLQAALHDQPEPVSTE